MRKKKSFQPLEKYRLEYGNASIVENDFPRIINAFPYMRAQFAAHSFIEGESALAVFGRSFYPRVSSLQLSDSWTESLSQHSQSNSSTGPCGVCGCTLLPVGVIQRKGTVDMEDLD